MRYGREIIKHLFGRWAKRPRIHYEFGSKVQADCDRSHIRVFETGLSAQRYGDFGRSEKAAAGEVCRRLIEIAREQGCFIRQTDWPRYGDRRRTSTGESIVFLDHDGKTFTKMKSPLAKAPIKNLAVSDAIYEHLIHNILFPSTRYEFVGITEDATGIRFVLQQKNIGQIFTLPRQKDIDDFLQHVLQLQREDSYFYGNDYFAITDVSAAGDNVLCDEDGRLYFIDPIIKFKKPAREVLDHLYAHYCN